jgi:hypothetical protein
MILVTFRLEEFSGIAVRVHKNINAGPLYETHDVVW